MSEQSTQSTESTQAPADTQATTTAPTPEIQHVALSDVYLPDEIRNDSAIAPIKNVTDLAKQAIHASRLVGAEKFVIPGKDATDEDWVSAFSKLGRPDTPEGYNLRASEAVPEGAIPNERLKEFAEFMHAKGAPAKLVQDAVSFYEGVVQQDNSSHKESQDQQINKTSEDLKAEFGNAVDDKLNSAKRALSNLKSGQAALEAFKGAGIANNINVVKLAIEIGEIMGEDRLIGLENQSRGLNGPLSPEMARTRINELMADEAFNKSYMNKYDPGHALAMEKLTKLQMDANPVQRTG